MNKKILLVDDDSNILSAYTRILRKNFELFTAQSGFEGLEILQKEGPFATIISDFLMPKMNGIQFLSRARKISPDTVRIILTGQADMQAAIDAINEGNIFRFLTKPCSPEDLIKHLDIAIEQYRLLNAERELLDQTFKGTIKILIDILSIINPLAFSQLERIRDLSINLAERSGMKSMWEIEIAILLSQIGCVTVPEEILKKKRQGEKLNENEEKIYFSHPQVAKELLLNIPRLEEIAEAIAYQLEPYNKNDFSLDNKTGKDIPLIARILKVVYDFDELLSRGINKTRALEILHNNANSYDPYILKLLEAQIMNLNKAFIAKTIPLKELLPGMVLADDIKDNNSIVLIPHLHVITELLKMRLFNYASLGTAPEEIKILQVVKKSLV